ncbi:tetratricopeptide repeat protein 28-like [Acropora millepora]|uniref:tetratricopeptide repeat protein 28-like n=1 Tax=Acropora millepora TaxID=45264 RepID=UPI001CF5BE09|nr:tetratricopeptide repeat protein 28-like [Acropora millepora]
MEYLEEAHQELAKKGLEDIRSKLCSPQQDVLERLKSKPEDFRFGYWFQRAEEYSNTNLQTARLIWKYLLEKCNDKQQTIDVLNKLFHVQIATGPWDEALKTAQKVFKETMEIVSQKTSAERSLDPIAGQYKFEACMNLATIQRLQRKMQEAEDLYREAHVAAASIRDLDKETLAKVHLAICLLDQGELKEATETYFKPLLPDKDNWDKFTQAIYLQSYGNACRSAADWGNAKAYLREALKLAEELNNMGLLSSCMGDLGNVFRSEGRYRDAERWHRAHYNMALKRGDTHGLAIACGNIGFLQFYNLKKFNDCLTYQFNEYSLAEQVGDFARMGISFNKIGKLYTTLGFHDEAVKLFQIAITQAQKANNVAGEGMAWGNLGTVHRFLEQYKDAIECHIKYRDNAERRMDIGGLAIMQRELAMDYYLSGNLQKAESSILSAFETLERIRAQIGEEDKSKISNYEKNQAEAYNLLQVVLVSQKKYKEAFVLADESRGRSLRDIVQGRLFGVNASETNSKYLSEEFITESFGRLLEVGRQRSTSFVLYSVVKEFNQAGTAFKWVYAWVLEIDGSLHFSKTRLGNEADMKVRVDEDFVISLSRSMGLQSKSRGVSEFIRDEFSSHNNALEDHSLSIEASSKENEIQDESSSLDNLQTANDHHSKHSPNAGNSQLNNLQDDPELIRPMLNQLHKVLIEPIAQFLPREGQSRRVTFIPQDFLLKVPFAALQEAPDYRYLFEDFIISTSPAIHFLNLAGDSPRRPEQNTSSLSVLAVGMPFEGLRGELKFAEPEARMVSQIIDSSDSELFIGDQAKKRDVVAAMPKHSILHFATHARLDEVDSHGDFSMKGLVFLSKSGNDCDGRLTAEEVSHLKLKAELVVLSCCETGLGKVTGDGVLGLSRAFLAAGAACVIVTLWKIDDEKSFELMTSFYREYKTCRDAAVSLQRATSLLQAKDDTKSPIYWGAFSIVGTSGEGLNGP